MLAVIGITGKNNKSEEKEDITEILYDNAYDILVDTMHEISDFSLITGGCSFSNHLAIRAYNEGIAKKLTLCLPAKIIYKTGRYEDTGYGKICNYHHDNFNEKCKLNSFEEILFAINKGAEVKIFKDFNKANNTIVENSDKLIAFTFSPKSIVEDWKNSVKEKIHINNSNIKFLWDKARNHKFKRHIGYKGMRGFNF